MATVKKNKKHQQTEPGDPIANLSDEDGRRLGEILRHVVRDQIQAKKPPIVEATFRRLMRSGEEEKNAIELITAVLAADIYDMMNEQREFDEGRYAAALRRLPELPYESDA